MDVLQQLGIPLPIATGALGLILAIIAGMGLIGRKNHLPVEGRVRFHTISSVFVMFSFLFSISHA